MKYINGLLIQKDKPWVLTAIIIAVLLIFIELIVATGIVSRVILRQPTEILPQLIAEIQEPDMQHDLFITTYRVSLTVIFSLSIGTIMTVILYQNELLRQTYIPILGALFGTPIVLLYLIFIVIFGRGTGAIVSIATLTGVIPIIINSTDALRSVDSSYHQMAQSFNASSFQIFRKVIIPAAAPGIFAGIRIGFSYMVTVVVAVELLIVVDGLGGRIASAYLRFDTTGLFVSITWIIILVILAIFLFRQIERRMIR